MAIVTAASNTSSFTPEPNPDSKTAPIQKATPAPETKASTEPTQKPASPMELSANALEQQGRSAARTLVGSFKAAFSDELAIGMEEVISVFIPMQDRQWANVIDVAAREIRLESAALNGTSQQRSLGAGE
jgi:hypothetical protein